MLQTPTATESLAPPAHLGAPTLSVRRKAWNFLRHFLEMCIAMCVAGNILILAVFSATEALTGSSDLRDDQPALSLFAIAILLTLPMVAWMRFRGMDWRPTGEMAAVAGLIPAVLALAVWVDLASRKLLLMEIGAFCGLLCLGMLAVMLPRLDLYTASHGSHRRHPAAHHSG
jgi:hypothetical protein